MVQEGERHDLISGRYGLVARPDTCKFRAVLSAFCAKRRRAVALLRRAIQHGRSRFNLLCLAHGEQREAPGGVNAHRICLQYQTVHADDAAHPAEISWLPKQLREMLPVEERNNRQLTRPSKEVVDMAFQMFWSAMGPLREAGKLGLEDFQFPPYFILKPANFDSLASLSERLPGASIAIEFRHPS